ncbi:UNVERIFIED_CONTAM: hypothetical protein Cloal_0369 [Acetivibrio alkalicellulosi]
MQWIFLFIVSWIIFFLFIDYKQLKINIWCGFFAILLQLSVDTKAMIYELYIVNSHIINLWGSSLLFVLGPVLTMGTLLSQYYPKKRFMRIISVFAFTALYTTQEVLLLYSGALGYLKWNIFDSIVVNTIVMAVLGWFSIVVLDKKGEVL